MAGAKDPVGQRVLKLAHIYQVACWTQLNDLDRAQRHADAATALPGAPNLEAVHRLRLRIAQGRSDEAVPELENWLDGDPDNPELMAVLAFGYAGMERYRDAAAMMTEAIDAVPPDYLVLRAVIDSWRNTRDEWRQRDGS